MKYRISCAETPEEKLKEERFTGIGLTSRKNLCIHSEVCIRAFIDPWAYSVCTWQVSKEKKGKVVDARCRDLINSSACVKGRENPGSVELCQWHEVIGSRLAFC